MCYLMLLKYITKPTHICLIEANSRTAWEQKKLEPIIIKPLAFLFSHGFPIYFYFPFWNFICFSRAHGKNMTVCIGTELIGSNSSRINGLTCPDCIFEETEDNDPSGKGPAAGPVRAGKKDKPWWTATAQRRFPEKNKQPNCTVILEWILECYLIWTKNIIPVSRF